MSRQTKLTARQLALEVLNRFDINKHDSAKLLNSMLSRTDQPGQATDIVFGVIRNRTVLDTVISKIASVPINRITKKILNAIRIGAYELIYAPRTAEYAILNEAVELVRSFAGKKPGGFANAVLRNIQRNIEHRTTELTDETKTKTLPQDELFGCEFKIDILPDPENLADYLSQAFSLPKWLTKEWIDELGQAAATQICFAQNRRPGVYLRPNTLKTTTENLLASLIAQDIESEKITVAPETPVEMIKIKPHIPVTSIEGFDQGLFVVQDPTAAKAAATLAPIHGQTIIDICSAPGGKTTHIAQLINDTGRIIATDIDSDRLKKVDENRRRLQINSIKTVQYEKIHQMLSEKTRFDCVMLDVPCSNTGVLARRTEARHRITPEIVEKINKTQRQLLKQMSALVKSGGKFCYSTCTILNEENSQTVQDFLAENPNYKLLSEELTLPQTALNSPFDCDGGYVAVMIFIDN